MMAGASVHHLHVYVRACSNREAFEEIVDELGLQVADTFDLHFEIDRGVRPAAQIDGRDRQCLVHGHDEITGAVDAPPVPERG